MDFFDRRTRKLIPSPNGAPIWWHSVPLPDGTQINGHNDDKFLQHKMWEALRLAPEDIKGKAVLDIGANDGFFSVAAALSGASHVTAINSSDWGTYPNNLRFIAGEWNVEIETISADFRSFELGRKYDIILFFGVIYHLEDVFTPYIRFRDLLNTWGSVYTETALTSVHSEFPIFQLASDCYDTSFKMDIENMKSIGLSNFLAPNFHAMASLAMDFGYGFESLHDSEYIQNHPYRGMYRFQRRPD